MLFRLRYVIAAAFLVICISIFTFALNGSAIYRNCYAEHSKVLGTENLHEHHSSIGQCIQVFLAANILEISSALTAAATIAIAFFTLTLWDTNREHLRHAMEIERAYVSGGGVKEVRQRIVRPPLNIAIPQHASVSHLPDGSLLLTGATGRFEVHINNHEKTPAHLHWIRFGFCEAASPPAKPVYGARRSASDSFGPGTQSRPIATEPIPEGPFSRPAIFGRFYWTDIWRRGWSVGFIHEIPGPAALPNGGLYIEAPAAYSDERHEPSHPDNMALER